MSDQQVQHAAAGERLTCSVNGFKVKVRRSGKKAKTTISTQKTYAMKRSSLFRNLPANEADDHVFFSIDGYTVEVCRSRRSLEAAFRLRYRAYLNVGAIPENEEGMLYDEYDFLPNARTHLVRFEGKPVATVRACIFSDVYDRQVTEAVTYFPDTVEEKLGPEPCLLESNRYAVDPDFQGRRSLFAQMLLFRTHGLNAVVHDCDYIITSVRANHVPFYRRFLEMEPIADQAIYIPWADAEVFLLASSPAECREAALKRGMPDYTQDDALAYAAAAGFALSSSRNAA